MDKYEASKVIEKQLCTEIIQIAENIQKAQSLTPQDLERIDKLYHALKSKENYEAMKDADEYSNYDNYGGMSGNQNGNSGYRGRAMNGRFVSRAENASYSNGYSQGYADAMRQSREGNSEHYPMMPMDYGSRRW